MNVYDFDGTIYRGDSSLDFYIHCLFRFPFICIHLPYQLWVISKYKCGFCTKEEAKSAFFSFLKSIPDIKHVLNSFWKRRKKYVASWYTQQQRKDDIIISASPEFLLAPLCTTLGITHLIASKVDFRTGCLSGKNCYGEEKVHRLREYLPGVQVDNFYSDSVSDLPLAKIAARAFLVKNASFIIDWK